MALTLTPKSSSLYSDNTTSNHLTLNAADGATPRGNTTFSGTVKDSHGKPAGTVTITGKSAVNGDVIVIVATQVTDTLTLTLTDQTIQDSATCTLTSVAFDPVTFTYNPATLNAPGADTITAHIYEPGTTVPVAGVPLVWSAASGPTPAYLPQKNITTTADPASFQYVTGALTQAQLDALNGFPIDMTLGIQDASFSYPLAIALTAPLLPPKLLLPPSDQIINDQMISGFADSGIPFWIPPLANSSRDDQVVLMGRDAKGQESVLGNGPTPLDILPDSTAAAMRVNAPTQDSVFATNGTISVYYAVTRAATADVSISEEAKFTVARSKVPAPPDGMPNPGLTPPSTSTYAYTLDDLNAATSLDATVDFNGVIQPQAGDIIQVKIYMLGYTTANMNWLHKVASTPYTIVAADLNGTTFKPHKFSFPSTDFANINGSNAAVYFVYTPIDGSGTIRSPERDIIVDTIPPYSSHFATIGKLLARHQ